MKIHPRILVATDVVADARLIAAMLHDEFGHVAASVDPEKVLHDFEQQRPNVLVLAFDSVEKSESYYLDLYRLEASMLAMPHRTVILCGKDELRRTYEWCRQEYFDDYVLFWPLNHDAPRLQMAVHQALRFLNLGAVAAAAGAPNQQTALQRAAAVRQATAGKARPLLLVVEDDEFQHTLLRALLVDFPADLAFAKSAGAALGMLRNQRPDLILMDIDLPDIDGIETTRRIKAVERHADVQVLMMTGHGDKDVVVKSMRAGACGFVVKPLNRTVLLAKIKACLGTDAAPAD